MHNDWLICAGDVCDGWTEERFTDTLQLLRHRFAKVIWTAGNHELYTLAGAKNDDPKALRGVAKYDRLVQLARNVGVVTPEDPYEKWPGPRSKNTPSFSGKITNDNADVRMSDETLPDLHIAPVFTLYDYSYRPKSVLRENCIAWAQETKVMCTDEFTLHPDPYPTRDDWCHARVAQTEERLNKLMENVDENGNAPHTILASHFSLRYDMVYSPYLPRFSMWCGTKLTEDWHTKYNAEAVVFGHTHVRNTTVYQNCTFVECSLGYPNQYNTSHKITDYISQVVPAKVEMEGCSIC
jgi:3',5'-cyclic AMP phosphodiesterase CpdA